MPKITVTERDLSWYFRQREQGAATVYVPGIATFGPEDKPVFCDSTNFSNVFGTHAVKMKGEKSYDMAASFIKSGFNVLFHRFSLPGSAKASYTLGSGDNAIVFTAKYNGSFGNEISLALSSASEVPGSADMMSAFVTINGVVVETLIYNFTDPTDKNYYEGVLSNYIEVAPKGDTTKITITPDVGSVSQVIKLTGGLDYKIEGLDDESTADEVATKIKTQVWASIKTPTALTDLEDPYQYDFDVIVNGGWALYDEGPAYYGPQSSEPWNRQYVDLVDKSLWSLAVNRGTAVYLVDGKSSWEDTDLYAYCGNFDSSYVAAYGPWCQAQLTSTGVTTLLPGSYTMIISWAQSCAGGTPIWMAPAGVKRATLGSFFKDTKYTVGKKTLDMWQNHGYIKPGQYCVNPIMRIKQYGYVIYGNSTLLKTRSDGATSMLQSFSTRVLANIIKLKAFDIALNLQFDQLTGDLFIQYRTLLGTFMDQLKYQDALYDYEIVLTEGSLTSANLNEKTIPVTIRISPTPAAENFDITLEVTQSGVMFSDETDENEIA